ncbi:MAG: hypothetical protein ACFFHD_15295 [Promethearchaeota archaeon]
MPTQPKTLSKIWKGLYKKDQFYTIDELEQLWLRQQKDLANKKTVYYFSKSLKDSQIEYTPDLFKLMIGIKQ